jgi:glycerophosphoryl diester phosphodiesterase
VLAAVDEAGMRKRVIVQGFDWRPLLELKRMAPEIETACLTIESRQMNTVAPGPDGRSPWHAGLALRDHDGSVPALVRAAGCATWSPSRQDLTRALVDEAHALGLRVIPWTVNDEAEMRRLIDLGVDGIITDYPDRLRKAVQAKGLPLP